MEAFEQDIKTCVEVLHTGGLILFASDTGWCVGCDATDETAVAKLVAFMEQSATGDIIVLMADERDVLQWVAAPDLAVFDFVAEQPEPTAIVFEHALGFPDNLVAPDGSITIRLEQDVFCRHLLKRFRKPLATITATISGQPPENLTAVNNALKNASGYVVQWRRAEMVPVKSGKVIRWNQEPRM